MDGEQTGTDLAAVLAAEGPMEPARAVAVVGRVAPLLDATAAEGFVREVTPSEVLLAGDEVRLAGAGTPADALAGRADVVSLARVLFESLTGRPPAAGAPTAPSALRPDVPHALDDVVLRGLDRGYADCGEFAGAAAAALPATEPIEPIAPAGASGAGDPVGGGRTGRTGRLAVVLGAVAVLAVLAVVLVLVLTGGSDDDDAAEPAATDTSASRPSDAPTAAEDTDDPVQAQLRATIPADWIPVDCDHGELPDDGAIAALGCGAASTQPGPEDSVFYRYDDAATVDAVFLADMERNGVGPLPEGASCRTAFGYSTYEIDGEPAGRMGCYIDEDNNGILVWTRDAVATEALVTVMDGGQIGLDVLYDWWVQEELSDFILP